MEDRTRNELPESRSLIIDRGRSGRLEVALTFDAGEGAGYTEDILDLLQAYSAWGTFGITGQWAEQHPELVRRIVDECHQVMNHSYNHPSFTGFSTRTIPLEEDERRQQIEITERIIEDITGGYKTRPYFRFPYGDYDGRALDLLRKLGYRYTLWWSCDTQGWNGSLPDEIVSLCGTEAEKGGPGAILLMHVANANDWNALEPLIEDYREVGYDFVTVEQLIEP